MDGGKAQKKPINHRNDSDITSYFISNIPTVITKEEFRRIFKSFGTLSDIYFGGRKRKHGKNCGFVRFEGVTDKMTLESKLNEIDYKFECVVSARIVGLPIKLWSESNFSAIVEKFGKIIILFDHIAERLDLSVVKIGILIEEKKKINEVIRVEVGAEIFDVGVVGYEDELWFPFKFEDGDQPYQSEPDDNSDGGNGSSGI
ncbi:unnamed protein product [Lactuca saligna]|uniref:RRM domain-containing protein n=1 Tax=Lactuca saligna TaxID=75948 RepID=A0AA35YQX6_LACSI|nr:unnamed protein product [Lactuca saligna]